MRETKKGISKKGSKFKLILILIYFSKHQPVHQCPFDAQQTNMMTKLGFSLHLFYMGLIKNTTPIARGTRCIYFSLEKRFVPLVYPPHFCRHPSTKNCPKVPSRRLIFASLALKQANISESEPRLTPQVNVQASRY